jgi:hypothetical protein
LLSLLLNLFVQALLTGLYFMLDRADRGMRGLWQVLSMEQSHMVQNQTNRQTSMIQYKKVYLQYRLYNLPQSHVTNHTFSNTVNNQPYEYLKYNLTLKFIMFQ